MHVAHAAADVGIQRIPVRLGKLSQGILPSIGVASARGQDDAPMRGGKVVLRAAGALSMDGHRGSIAQ